MTDATVVPVVEYAVYALVVTCAARACVIKYLLFGECVVTEDLKADVAKQLFKDPPSWTATLQRFSWCSSEKGRWESRRHGMLNCDDECRYMIKCMRKVSCFKVALQRNSLAVGGPNWFRQCFCLEDSLTLLHGSRSSSLAIACCHAAARCFCSGARPSLNLSSFGWNSARRPLRVRLLCLCGFSH